MGKCDFVCRVRREKEVIKLNVGWRFGGWWEKKHSRIYSLKLLMFSSYVQCRIAEGNLFGELREGEKGLRKLCFQRSWSYFIWFLTPNWEVVPSFNCADFNIWLSFLERRMRKTLSVTSCLSVWGEKSRLWYVIICLSNAGQKDCWHLTVIAKCVSG